MVASILQCASFSCRAILILSTSSRRLPRAALTALCQHLVAVGIAVVEAEVFQFLIDRVQAQPIGDRRVDFQGFRGDAAAFFRRHRLHGVHVVQAVGQLDQDDAHILRHGQQHLAEVFGLRMLLGGKSQLVELGNAFDQQCHRLAKARLDLDSRWPACLPPRRAAARRSGFARRDASRPGCRQLPAGGRYKVRRSCGTGLRGRYD